MEKLSPKGLQQSTFGNQKKSILTQCEDDEPSEFYFSHHLLITILPLRGGKPKEVGNVEKGKINKIESEAIAVEKRERGGGNERKHETIEEDNEIGDSDGLVVEEDGSSDIRKVYLASGVRYLKIKLF